MNAEAIESIDGKGRAAFGLRRQAQRDSALAVRCKTPLGPGLPEGEPKRRRRCALPAHSIELQSFGEGRSFGPLSYLLQPALRAD
jgi:hypothetical protein